MTKVPVNIGIIVCYFVAEPYGDANPFLSQLHNNNTRGLVSSAMYSFMKRNRSEKRAIPEEQKDEKYFERRRRNNEAAKKSRDARKMREDQVFKL